MDADRASTLICTKDRTWNGTKPLCKGIVKYYNYISRELQYGVDMNIEDGLGYRKGAGIDHERSKCVEL